MGRDPLGILVVRRVLHGAEIPDLVLLRDDDEAARVLARGALDVDAAGGEAVFLRLGDSPVRRCPGQAIPFFWAWVIPPFLVWIKWIPCWWL